jgi:hypothetical protein
MLTRKRLHPSTTVSCVAVYASPAPLYSRHEFLSVWSQQLLHTLYEALCHISGLLVLLLRLYRKSSSFALRSSHPQLTFFHIKPSCNLSSVCELIYPYHLCHLVQYLQLLAVSFAAVFLPPALQGDEGTQPDDTGDLVPSTKRSPSQEVRTD